MRKFFTLLAVLVFCFSLAFAQTQEVTGKVTDASGAPVPGATIKVKGSKAGGTTDANGFFKCKASPNSTLIISGIGFEQKEVSVGNSTSLNISLKQSSSTLNEVVVTTALGVKKQARQLGYSTATIGNSELTQARTSNFVTGLAAKVAGVDIRLADNGINPNVKVTFRGSRSITGNNSALIVVDGNPVDQSYLATLNPDDIDNATILKGPNAAALYGKDAANGVMIITTKHGKKGPLSVNYKNTTMAEQVAYMPALQTEYSPNGGEGSGYNNPSNTGGCIGCVSYLDPLTGTALPVPFENQNYGTPYNSQDFPYSQIAVGLDQNGNIKYVPFAPVKNGRRDFFQTGLSEQNDLSISQGGKIGSFFISGSNVINKGVIPTEKNTRNTITGNGTLSIGKFSASGGITYSTQSIHQVGLGFSGGTQYRPVYWDVINQPANVNLSTLKNVDTDPYASLQGYANAYYPNPWYQVSHSRSNQENHNLITNLTLNYQLFKWLKITAKGGYNKRTRNAPASIDSASFYTYKYGVFASNPTRDPWAGGGTAAAYSSFPYQNELVKTNFNDLNTDGFLTFTKKLNRFSFILIGGVNYRSQNSNGYWYSNQATTSIAIPNGSTKVTNSDGSAYENLSYKSRSQAAYGDLSISYDEWINLHGSYRNDWLSILDPKTRSFNYYGADAALVISDKIESFKEHNVYLKLRGGYAITGNASIAGNTGFGYLGAVGSGFTIPNYGAYSIYPTVSVGSGYPYGNLNGYSLSTSTYQSQLEPEKDYSTEVGFELGLLNNRIALDVSGFNTQSKKLTLPLQTSTASGISNFTLNAGQMNSKGYEIGLKLIPIKSKEFSWNVGINFSQLDNKVVKLLPGSDTLVLLNGTTFEINAISGNPYPILFVKDFLRDPSGHIIVDGTSGLPTVNPNLQAAGNTQYKYFLGLTSTVNFKRFTVNMVWDYRSGAKILNTVGAALDFAGISSSSAANRSHFIVPNSVIDEGNGKYEQNTNIPITGAPSTWWYSTYSTVMAPYVVSAAFWKLREVSISYDIPMQKNGFVKSVSFALVGQNLLMIRPKTNQWTDPEFSAQGTGNAVGYTSEYQTPPTRRFGFTINANF